MTVKATIKRIVVGGKAHIINKQVINEQCKSFVGLIEKYLRELRRMWSLQDWDFDREWGKDIRTIFKNIANFFQGFLCATHCAKFFAGNTNEVGCISPFYTEETEVLSH